MFQDTINISQITSITSQTINDHGNIGKSIGIIDKIIKILEKINLKK